MLQGTGSSVGKSVLVAGLARACAQRGLRVRPFKPQNMSNNAAVTGDGGEIGRAQALQARAAGVAPSVHMNPVLLKPQSETGSQIVVQGRVWGTARAREYQAIKPRLLPAVLESFARLRDEADLVLVEGAGSASEINLRAGDIANMGFARAADVPVVLVGDIDRGGVIASLVGTHTVLHPDDAALVRGFIVNRMRGDLSLFADGMHIIAQHTGWPALGLVPHCDEVRRLPAEDAADLADWSRASSGGLQVVVPVLPGISNFDDLDPLRDEPGVCLRLIRPGQALPGDADVVILAGSKTTISDLQILQAQSWDEDLRAHVRRGGHVIGLCGGYQMLGRTIADPHGIEGFAGTASGLGLLNVETVLRHEKRLRAVSGTVFGAAFTGYEMHLGITQGVGTKTPLLHLANGTKEGAISACGHIAGTTMHGLLNSDAARVALLQHWGAATSPARYECVIEAALDMWAVHLEKHLAIDDLISLAS